MDTTYNILESLGKIPSRLSEDDFLSNKGLSNEVGIHVFCYKPEDEVIVSCFFDKLTNDKTKKFNLIKCDLYEILLEICEEKRILNSIPTQEERKGKEFIINQLHKIATPEAYVKKMEYGPHTLGDILLITGVGKVYPFMRSHKILDNIQHVFSDIPIVMLYPGTFNGQDLNLFGKFLDGHYYRAFSLM